MTIHVLPPDTRDQLQILHALSLEYSPAQERFDRITRLTRRIFDVQTSFVWVMTNDRQWFRTSNGLDTTSVPYDVSFCGHAIVRKDTFVVRDARAHPEVSNHPLVTGPPYIRFFATQPICVRDEVVGALCIFDDRPRDFTERDLDALKNLGVLAAVECAAVTLSEVQEHQKADLEQDYRRMMLDRVTRCWNGTALQRMLTREIALASLNHTPFAYLHLQLVPEPCSILGLTPCRADAILSDVAGFVKRSIRPYDLLARIGPATFAIYAPVCTIELSDLLIDRIRSRIASIHCEAGGVSPTFDFCAGVVVCGEAQNTVTPTLLSSMAEAALQEAVKHGQIRIRTMI